MDEQTDAAGVVEAIEAVGVDRLTDAIVDAWERAGLDVGTPTWPDDEPRYRLRAPAVSEGDGLDALAAVLDSTPRTPETLFCYLSVGRRAELVGPDRVALEALSGHADVTVDDDHAAGTVPLTGETFGDVAQLFEDVAYALVRDADGVAVAEWRDGTVRFALPADALDGLSSGLDASLAERIEQVE